MYGSGWRWTMTERGEKSTFLSKNIFSVGPSKFQWLDNHLEITIDEISNPHFDRVKGVVKIIPKFISEVEVPLTSEGTHIWRPFSPNSRIEVDIKKKGWQWNGHGYFDANFGTRALEQDFTYWTWARLPLSNSTATIYDAKYKNGSDLGIGLNFLNSGEVEIFDPPENQNLSKSLWFLKRQIPCEKDFKPRQIKHMLDTPFYTRSAVKTKILGEVTSGVHETLDLKRFSNPFIKPMLAVRIPRKAMF